MFRRSRIGLGAILGAFAAAVVWSVAYHVTGGQVLVAILVMHAVVGGVLGLYLTARGGITAGTAALASGTLMIAGPAAMSGVAPFVAGFGRIGQLGLIVAGGTLIAVVVVISSQTSWGRRLQGLATGLALASLVLLPRPVAAPPAIELAQLAVAGDAPLSRVAVIGIDGGDWSVIDPMIQNGELPVLEGLIDRGVRGILRSIEPTYSPVVWTSIFSGLTPAQHGIRGWYTATAVNRKVPLLWELVGAAGASAIAINIPGSWPPRAFPGAIVAGFPMPRLVVSETRVAGQFLGRVVSSSARSGIVPSVPWVGNQQSIPLGREQILARSLVRHPVLEAGIRRRWLMGPIDSLELRITKPLEGEGALPIEANGQQFALRRGDWSPWIDIEAGNRPAFLRIRRLATGDLYVTPPFQSPRAPRFAFIAGEANPEIIAPDGHYVVEGVGWKAATDLDMHAPLAEHLEQVSDLQLRAAMALSTRPWKLFAFVFTLPDRLSHAFWSESTTASERGLQPHGISSSTNDRVRDAYRRVDGDLGRLLSGMGSDVTVFVVSDHGFTVNPAGPGGTHREEGIFIASGPGIRAQSRLQDLSVYDVAPLLLAGMGLPVARDMAHRPMLDLFQDPVTPRFVASYGRSVAGQDTEHIDESTEEQLRALGYIE